VQFVQGILGHEDRSDLLQDLIGAHALLHRANPYPDLAPAITRMGGLWLLPTNTYSTHPPTAFLFLLPVADQPWPLVSALWTIVLLAALATTGLACGLRGRTILLLAPLLLWPPALTSAGQLTPLWLLGLALAWRCRSRPVVAGVLIGLASLPKFYAAVAIIPFVRRRAWGAVIGFGSVWAIVGTALLCLDARALPDYIATNRVMMTTTVGRLDNGALLPYTWHTWGVVGLMLATLLILGVTVITVRRPAFERGSWALWVWLSVALLPIAWTYSLLPLLPGLLHALRVGCLPVRALAVLALLAPFLGPLPSSNPLAVALTLVLSAVALALTPFEQQMSPWYPYEIRGPAGGAVSAPPP